MQQEKLAMIVQRLERQETKEIRGQEALNCEPVVHNEIEDQDRQRIETTVPVLMKLRKGNPLQPPTKFFPVN